MDYDAAGAMMAANIYRFAMVTLMLIEGLYQLPEKRAASADAYLDGLVLCYILAVVAIYCIKNDD